MTALAALSLLFLIKQCTAVRHFTIHSTAEASRRWSIAAVTACLVSISCRWLVDDSSVQVSSAIQYFAAVMLLTPLISVLGARRPGTNAWPWFVVLPLIVVLQWPSLSQLMSEDVTTAIEIPAPTAIGFLLVLVMGSGNYFGTSNTGTAVVSAAGTLLFLLPVTDWIAYSNGWHQPTGCILLAFASSLLPGRYASAQENAEATTPNASGLWIDFRDLYGIVWAKRVMDRLNQFSERERWDVRLSLDGFVQINDGSAVDSVEARPLQILCWILRRFVDAAFLRRYLPEELVDQQAESE